MPVTYKKIASVTVGSGGAATIDFQSIPGTYTDLVLKFSTRLTVNNGSIWQAFGITFNNTTANRSQRFLFGTGSSTGSGNDTNIYGQSNESSTTASTFASGEMYVSNYASSNNKSVSLDQTTENNATGALAYLTAALWSNSAAINRITLDANAFVSSNFAQHSTAVLYGIAKS
jgi:hypothetical protein